MCKCPYLGHKNSQDIPLYQAPDIIAPKTKAQQCELQPRFENYSMPVLSRVRSQVSFPNC